MATQAAGVSKPNGAYQAKWALSAVACAITAGSANDVARRVREGWSIIRSTVPAITAGRALLGER